MTPRFHNVVSYTGALVVLPAAFFVQGGLDTSAGVGTWLPLGLWCAHFLRRTVESAALHRYSKPAFPLTDALIEYVYYWGFGTWIGWTLASAAAPAPAGPLWGGTLLFVLAELGNNKSHRMLAALRKRGDDARPIPHGFLFERVSSPHYLFEILSWVGFALATLQLASLCFLLVGGGILSAWAWQRHADYRKRFDAGSPEPYPPERRALVPWVF